MLASLSYAGAMAHAQAVLALRIDTKDPIEISDFVGAFTSLAEEYRRQIRQEYPDASEESRIYVKEVRTGSYEADLVPCLVMAAPFIAQMDQVLIVEQFVRTWGGRISALVSGNLEGWKPGKGELATWANATVAIARDPEASSTLEAATFEDGNRNVRAAFKFSTPEARDAQKTIDAEYRKLESPSDADHKRKLMVFTRTDVGDAAIGKRSGERVVIEEISEKPLALMYA